MIEYEKDELKQRIADLQEQRNMTKTGNQELKRQIGDLQKQKLAILESERDRCQQWLNQLDEQIRETKVELDLSKV